MSRSGPVNEPRIQHRLDPGPREVATRRNVSPKILGDMATFASLFATRASIVRFIKDESCSDRLGPVQHEVISIKVSLGHVDVACSRYSERVSRGPL